MEANDIKISHKKMTDIADKNLLYPSFFIKTDMTSAI